MKKARAERSGFTIVELLIVIVIIGILAAITIVAYNGIQQRAHAAAAQSDVKNASKLLGVDYVTNGVYPASLSVANGGKGISNPTDGTTYQYNASGNTYCLSATNAGQSFSVTDGGALSAGDCSMAGLVGWWKFDGGSTDETSNGNNATVSGVSSTTGQDGRSNGAYALSGSSSNITVGNSSVLNSSNITFSAWVNPSTLSGTQEIIAKESQYKYRLSGSSLSILVGLTGTGWTTMPTFSTSIVAGGWYNIACVLDSNSNTITGYVNGSVVGTASLGGAISSFNSNNIYIGSYNSGSGEALTGSIDDARIYNRALTAAQVQAIYTAGAQ